MTAARVLAIDDQPSNLLTLGASLGTEFMLQVATSGAEGLNLAAEMTPDLILLDVMMPEMDGYETCRRLKADPRLRSIPVVFVTALGDAAAESAGLALGAADYITKPINVEIARQRIKNLIEGEQLRKEVEAQRNHLEQLVEARTLALSIAKEAAEAGSRAKSLFLSNTGHELRTPMNGIMGMIDLALRKASDPQQKDYLGKAAKASKKLLAAISDILEMSHIEAERLALEQADFKLHEVLERLLRLNKVDADAKGLTLDISIAPEHAEMQLLGDPLRLGQILNSLTGNAIKFTAVGSVTVGVQVVEESATDILLRCAVSDTGIGIPAKDQQRIFAAFEQADESTLRQHGGTGLGLAISKRLAQAMGGDILVESQVGVGSTFVASARLQKSVKRAAVQPPEACMASLGKQHDEITRLVARIGDCVKNQVWHRGDPEQNMETFRALINDLFELTLEHFRCEEDVLTAFKYPLLAEHLKEHNELLEHFSALLTAGLPEFVDIIGISKYLTSWFARHEQGSDTAYGSFLREKLKSRLVG